MYFAIAVILFYGISIAMLVAASTLKRSRTDYELKGFLRSYARIEEEKRTREKQLVRSVLQQRNLLHLWPGYGHRPSFLSRLDNLRRASRTSACSNATSKKSSIDRTSLLDAITEERRRASFPEKRMTSSEQGVATQGAQGSLFKTRSCAEVVVAGLEKMAEMEGGVVGNGGIKQEIKKTTGSAPSSTTIRESPTVFQKQRVKLHSLRCKPSLDPTAQRQQHQQQLKQHQHQQLKQQHQHQHQLQLQDVQMNSNQRLKHKKISPQPSKVVQKVPVVTVELFEDASADPAEVKKVTVQDDLVIHGSMKRPHRRSSEICLKNVLGS